MRAPAEHVPVVDLTDEELAALDARGCDGLVVLPYLDTLDRAQRDVAVVTAFRGLVARGLVDGPSRDDATRSARKAAAQGREVASVDVRMSEELAQVLMLRRIASTVVCVQRTLSELQQWRYLHVLDGELALDEVVEPTGLHRFSLLCAGDVADAVLAWLVPERCEQADGPPQTLSAQEAAAGRASEALLERLASAQVVGDVTIRRAGDSGGGTLLGTFAAPGMLVLSRTAPAQDAKVELRPASRSTVRAALVEQLETP